MPSPGAPTEPTQPAAFKLPGVRLFGSGQYRGKPWPPSSILRAADNAAKLGDKLLVPPGVAQPLVPDGGVGHGVGNFDWLKDDTAPAAGWVDPKSVKAVPDPDYPGQLILVGDVVNVPPETAAKIKSGQYRYGSAELYENFIDDFGKSYGPALRRFVILGAEVPQVKRLGPLPMPVPMAELMVFAEPASTKAVLAFSFLAFSERSAMDRAAATAAIKAAMPGLSQATLDSLSDDQLKDMVANLPQPAEAPAAPAVPNADAPPAPAAAPSRDEMIAALVAAGQDQATVTAMDDATLAAAYAAITAAPAPMMADAPPDDPDDPTKKKPFPPVAVMSETEQKAAASLKNIQAHEEAAKKRNEVAAKRERDAKRKDAETFCEGLVKSGKLLPHQKADYISILTPLDDSTALHKFSENGKTETLTAFELKKRELQNRPKVVTYGEKVPGGGTSPQDAKSAAMDKARERAETIGTVALKSTRFGSVDGFVHNFSEMYDKDPAGALATIA